MKFKFEDLRVGDILRDNSGFKTGHTIKVKKIHTDQISTEGYYGSFTKDYLEQHFEFVKRTEFKIGDKVRLQRSTKNPRCDWNFSDEMKICEHHKSECTIIEIKKGYNRIQIPDWVVSAETRHIVPVFESEEEKLIVSAESEKTLDYRIELLEEKLRNMSKYEKELEELKLAKKILTRYL